MLPMLYDRSSGRSPVSLIEEMRRDMDRLMEQAFRDEWWPTARLGAGLPDGAPTWLKYESAA
jgi:hypothetical protein